MSTSSARSTHPAFRILGRGAATLGAAALALLGAQPSALAVAPAAPAHSAPAPVTHAAASLEPLCGSPGEGEAACLALRAADQTPLLRLSAATTPPGLGPKDIQSAYSLPADGGAGQTIAIVDAYDNPNAEADLAVYRAQYGLPPCTTANGCFKKVDQRGGTDYPQTDNSWAGEIALDLDMVSAAAPGAHILLIETDNAGLENLAAGVDRAVALGAKFVSNSYGRTGDLESDLATYGTHYDHPGVAVVAASGDYRYGLQFPSTLPFVTAVGGTNLSPAPDTARGWTESVWTRGNYGPGSGCAQYQAKPEYQKDTGCSGRTVADVSAVADNVAVYHTYGNDGIGWQRYGGTSVSAPLIASVYALAGSPRPGTHPAAYPYAADGAGLNDVTSGTNGPCDTDYLCTAGPGYDGPTGLGTPAGLAAFRSGPHGTLSGTVKDSATGKPVARATVGSGLDVAVTDDKGAYKLDLPAGTIDGLTARSFGYTTSAPAALSVADGQTYTRDFRLNVIKRQKVRGTVEDGSGHGWPLYAKIAVDGSPEAPVWTDPATGRYELSLPEGATYSLNVAADLPGYEPAERKVPVGKHAVTGNFALTADPDTAEAVGYRLERDGTTETFDSTSSAPQGWTVANAHGTDNGWQFDDPFGRGNMTGGTGSFAIVESDNGPFGPHQDTQLTSPVYDLSGGRSAELEFKTAYLYNPSNQKMSVEATTDGGATWETAWASSPSGHGPAERRTVHVSLRPYAGEKAVQLRFHFVADWGYFWSVDDVYVGTRDLAPVSGALAVGTVRERGTGTGLTGATVADPRYPAAVAVTTPTPEDPAIGDGFYTLFVASPGKGGSKVTLRAGAPGHTDAESRTTVRKDDAVRQDFRLTSG
ncbi:carboxypeptidase regulatory-like domain-containing protein [Streptomyces sp. NBC_01341]|uniref:carboxypeptidase regulatory-like domain-containing protein n=1 Tax=Streptomyces sp. NBC_01341 TaxID=2903831 RepID=UPI002E122710|nr:carboxypeptidase regulatory-like domain-containing protein [Streptomyces sp. NBC_01341]